MTDDGYWFRPKMFGLGITPVTWQGWAMTLGLVIALLAVGRWLPTRTEQVIVCLALTAAFLAIAAGKTRGGWHWRWGGED